MPDSDVEPPHTHVFKSTSAALGPSAGLVSLIAKVEQTHKTHTQLFVYVIMYVFTRFVPRKQETNCTNTPCRGNFLSLAQHWQLRVLELHL